MLAGLLMLVSAVSLSELKAHLSKYVRKVQRGAEVQVLHRGKPVARLCGLERTQPADAERRDRLIAGGLLRPGTGDASGFLRQPPLKIDVDVGAALDAEREDRL
jgi:prevent-host-death family protein